MDGDAAKALLRELVVDRALVNYHGRVRRSPLARLELAEGKRDPYALYEEIRRRGPVSEAVGVGHQTATHAVCRAVLRDRRCSVAGDAPSRGRGQLSFLEMDPPDHTRLRRLAAPAFSPRAISGYAPRITGVLDALLDALPTGERFDLVQGVAGPMPIAVVSDLLGVPDANAVEFARYGATIGSALSGVQSVRHAVRLVEANGRLARVFGEVVELKRREPGEDLISRLVAEDAPITPAELVPLCTLLLVAGFETTVNLIGNTVLALLQHPDAWRAVVEDPALAAAAVEETLRYDPPVQRTFRIPTEEVELAGVTVPPGRMVVLLLAGANRDPEAYPDPGRFDLFRSGGPDHLAFSAGLHYCLGAPLARLEATLAVQRLAERFPRLQRAGRLRRRSGSVIRGPSELVLRDGPAPSARAVGRGARQDVLRA